MTRTLFISDLHLSVARPATVEVFTTFLRSLARKSDSLYILGDLFDAWIGDDDRSALAIDVRAELAELGRQTPVYLQHGNRDFLIGKQFCEDTGATLLDDYHLLNLYEQPTLLMHGDLLCTDDIEYQQARVQLRNPAFIADFLNKPITERAQIAAKLRKRSGEATSMKATDIMDVSQQTVLEVMRKHGVTRLIHGHTHRPDTHRFLLHGQPAERVVLADWHPGRVEILAADESGLQRLPFPRL